MKKVVIACVLVGTARFRIEGVGVDPRHPRLHYANRSESVQGMPIGVRVVDLMDGSNSAEASRLRRSLGGCLPEPVELADLAATLVRLDEEDAAGAQTVAQDLERVRKAEIAEKHDKADRYAARADAHERRHEYTEAVKLRAWARRERLEAGTLELAGRLDLSIPQGPSL